MVFCADALQNLHAVLYVLLPPVWDRVSHVPKDMFSYYGIAAAVTISIINYLLLGFQFNVDGFYLHSFEIWLATTVVFFGSGTVGYSVLQYRIGHKQLVRYFDDFFLERIVL